MKYQFCIRFANVDINTASSKAVLDCNKIFNSQGYIDYTFTVADNSNRLRYYYSLLKEMVTFFFAINKGSVAGIQYPLLSINNVFKYFIKIAKFKGVKFFCVIHDLISIRNGGTNRNEIENEVKNLNYYDVIIAHNPVMLQWLKDNGVKQKMSSLGLFDYLTEDFEVVDSEDFNKSIVFAGNLNKSTFIYSLPEVKKWSFNVYGPNFDKSKDAGRSNLNWCGVYSPDEIANKLTGDFGLIWDGNTIDNCNNTIGNYLKYNNPHKFSLYIAAGLPVIAPANSAIAGFIKNYNIGILVNSLYELDNISIEILAYHLMKKNVLKLREKVIHGTYFTDVIKLTEEELTAVTVYN